MTQIHLSQHTPSSNGTNSPFTVNKLALYGTFYLSWHISPSYCTYSSSTANSPLTTHICLKGKQFAFYDKHNRLPTAQIRLSRHTFAFHIKLLSFLAYITFYGNYIRLPQHISDSYDTCSPSITEVHLSRHILAFYDISVFHGTPSPSNGTK